MNSSLQEADAERLSEWALILLLLLLACTRCTLLLAIWFLYKKNHNCTLTIGNIKKQLWSSSCWELSKNISRLSSSYLQTCSVRALNSDFTVDSDSLVLSCLFLAAIKTAIYLRIYKLNWKRKVIFLNKKNSVILKSRKMLICVGLKTMFFLQLKFLEI